MFAWVCRRLLGLMGWRFVDTYPHEIQKMLILVAPHTTSIDFWIGIFINFGWRMRGQFYAKEELFSGLKGRLLRRWGGLPIKRSGGNNMVQTIVNDIKGADRRILVIAPEGTRDKVAHFKSGFYHIAHGAQIPILPAIFDYEKKEVRLKDLYYTTGDAQHDIETIESYYRGIKGKYPEKSF